MSVTSTYLHYITSPSTIHVLSYGSLCGMTLWHSFLGGPIAYKTIPRQQFGNLQSKLFPPFFALQIITGTVCFATAYYDTSASVNELYVLGGIVISGIANLAAVGPWTTNIMNERHKLERSTNTKYTDPNPSEKMQSLNFQFNIAHSVSSIINLAVVGGIILHAIHLGHKLDLLRPYDP